MKFGEIPVAEAMGAVLAHSTSAGSRRFKKGRRLERDDIAILQSSGIEHVTAAVLDDAELDEDAAANQLASAIAGAELEIGEAFTGRVNLFAKRDGLLLIDRDGIDRFNRENEAITVATLPVFASVHAGQMVATVKIIPFAVAEAAVQACLSISGAGLIEIAPYRQLTVKMIQTELPGLADKVLDKTERITRERLQSIGSVLAEQSRCLHKTEALTEAINHQGAFDVLLIAGASAITDRRDVLPAAIEQAGGSVHHFGMPVDPGNLLLFGELNSRPVIGMPGCARSPKLNGFDWVLQRIAAGIDVSPKEIMGMGVGGLLTEISSRPQPRLKKRKPSAPHNITAIILAAGQSRRMGEQNKLLIQIDGRTMLNHVVTEVEASRASDIIVVTGHESDRIESELEGLNTRLVHNEHYAEGLSSSLKRGLQSIPEEADGALVCLGDMPLVTREHYDKLIGAFNPTEGRSIVVPTRNGKRGNPVLWSRELFAEMNQLEGDVGARHLIGLHEESVAEVEFADSSVLADFDTPEAISKLQQGIT